MYNVAIVEDEELERRALSSILTRNRSEINIIGEARNGAQAVDLLDNHSIDLMLVDINIPKPNGLEIIQIVRDRQLHTKIIILTAYDYFEIMQTAIHLKTDEYLLKPVRTEALLQAVDDCLKELGSHRTNSEIAGQIWYLLEQNCYCDCLSQVRRHIEWIYAQKGVSPRQSILEFSTAMLELTDEKKLQLPDALLDQINNLQGHKLDGRSRNAIQDIFCQMIDILFEVSEDHFGRSPERMQNVLNFIERNLHKAITLEEAADCASISPSYFSRLFKKTMNETFIAYVKQRRILRAKELLISSDLPITNIALDLSFQDMNYFSKVFKKEVGLSPTEYRRQAS
ncbi:response regulator transcription factor [Cohaesibacter celericrescens]|uniref:DNA-binding response regulator n=1 Tax=Cohaesibacter celericrescens TaxID=2067669 RepID=A0A2N5XQN5_9HYPH|nr:helix-turn-helix domain-containing protein [Cohaesibacter celericrescens]PLW76831.1 DNA-binding response regulator [Cohaesibacter celericrescens]